MKDIEVALSKDLGKEYLDAVKYYEVALGKNGTPISVYANLTFLYWEFAAEFTFRDAYGIPDTWSEIGGEKYPKVIELGLEKYPKSVELHFWKRYLPHRHYLAEFSQEECLQLVEKYGDEENVVPYFFLYLFDKTRYQTERNQLLEQCEELPTAKNNYIKSLIE